MGITKTKFSEIFEKDYPSLCWIAYGILKHWHDAEDSVSEVFAYIWDNREKYSDAYARNLLFVSVKHKCITEMRKRETYKNRMDAYFYFSCPLTECIDKKIIEADYTTKIYSRLDSLPPRAKMVFDLTYFEGKDAGQIARIMGTSVSTVTTQRSRIIKLIRDMI